MKSLDNDDFEFLSKMFYESTEPKMWDSRAKKFHAYKPISDDVLMNYNNLTKEEYRIKKNEVFRRFIAVYNDLVTEMENKLE